MIPAKFEVPALKVGLFGIGLNAYWEQFDGLETAKNTSCPPAERVNDQITFRIGNQHDC